MICGKCQRDKREILGDKWKTDPLCINLCNGGYGPTEFKFSEEHRQKLSDSHKGKPSPKKGKPCPSLLKHPVSEETREKIRQTKLGSKNPNYGKKSWNSGKECPYCQGRNNYQAKPVNQYSLDGELIKTWDCISDARKELNLGYSGISKNLHGYRKSAYGYIWKYAA